MMEIPEADCKSRQAEKNLRGRKIEKVTVNQFPHGFAWFSGDPSGYPALLTGRTIGASKPAGSFLEIDAEGTTLLFGDGAGLRHYGTEEERPPKHQLMLDFDDGSSLVVSVQMYGGIWAYPSGTNTNPYYTGAVEKPSPLTRGFNQTYFESLRKGVKDNLSVKAFLATGQRIPGLGNGVLQDILFVSGVHPAALLRNLSDSNMEKVYKSIKSILKKMTDEGGRDTEKDLYGRPGGYRTILSRNTLKKPCPGCGGSIRRKAFLGGNVYFCPECQPTQPRG